MDFTAETNDPAAWVRVYSDQEGTGDFFDRVWMGWDQEAGSPPPMEGRGGSYTSPPIGWGTSVQIFDQGTLSNPALFKVNLTGAAGLNNVWFTICFSSDSSVSFFPGTYIDNINIGTQPGGPLGSF